MEEYVRNIGVENIKVFNAKFNKYFDEYVEKAKGMGYGGKLKFKIEKGKVVIFAII